MDPSIYCLRGSRKAIWSCYPQCLENVINLLCPHSFPLVGNGQSLPYLCQYQHHYMVDAFGCCGLFLWRLVFIKRISNYRRTIWSIDYDSRPTLRCFLCIYLPSSNAYMAKSVSNARHSFGNCHRSVRQGRIE